MQNRVVNNSVIKISNSNKRKKEKSSNGAISGNSSISAIQAKIVCLLKSHPSGIALDKLQAKFQGKYNTKLSPQKYKCESLLSLLKQFNDVIYITISSVVFLKENISEDDDIDSNKDQQLQNAEVFSEIRAMKEKGINSKKTELVTIIKTILDGYGGICIMENIPHEFEFRTDHKFLPRDYGYKSLVQLITSFDDKFDLKVLSNGQSIVTLIGDSDIDEKMKSLELQQSISSNSSKFNKETKIRIIKLLTQHYPDGLEEDEINGAYKGLNSYLLTDLNPESYGMRTISEMFCDETDLVKPICLKKKMYYVTSNTYQTSAERIIGDSEEERLRRERDDGLPPDVVKRNEIYRPISMANTVRTGQTIDVVGGECYSPDRFYVQLHAKEHSNNLDILVNDMTIFYTSPIRRRYAVTDDLFLIRYPLAFYYEKDDCYYRGMITSWEDIENMKVYLVDYGTEYITTKDNVFLLHREFFKLPPQAIKAKLYGIKPPNNKEYYLRAHSEKFLSLILDEIFAALIHKIEANTLVITAFKVPQDKTGTDSLDDTKRTAKNVININKLLVTNNFAVYENKSSYDNDMKRREKSINSMIHRVDLYSTPETIKKSKHENECISELDDNREYLLNENSNKEHLISENCDKEYVVSENQEDMIINENECDLSNSSFYSVDQLNCSKTSRFLDYAKKCNEQQSIMRNSKDSLFPLSTRSITPSLTDVSSIYKTTDCNSNSDIFSAFHKSRKAKSNMASSPNETVDNYVANKFMKELSPCAAEFKPRSRKLSAIASEFKPMINSDAFMTDVQSNLNQYKSIKMTDNMDFSTAENEDIFKSDDDDSIYNMPAPKNNNQIDLHCKVQLISISPDCKIRAIGKDAEWYLALDELSLLIPDLEQLQSVFNVLDGIAVSKIDVNISKNLDLFLLLVRYGAEYLFKKDNKFLTRLQLIKFDLVIAIIQGIYPQKQHLLSSLKTAAEQFPSSSFEKRKDALSTFKLRDICLQEDNRSQSTDPSEGSNFGEFSRKVNSVSPIVSDTISYRGNNTVFPRVDDKWEAEAEKFGIPTKALKMPNYVIEQNQSFKNFPSLLHRAYPGVQQPPAFHGGHAAPRMQPLPRYLLPNYVIPQTQMPYNTVYSTNFY